MELVNGTPHVDGVRVDSGETLNGDLVVDAMGRRAQLPGWLSDADLGPVHEESEDSGFIYYGRYFRSPDGTTPQPFGPLLAPLGSLSVLTLPSDNGTWAVTLVTSSGDRVLKRMRDPDLWTAVVKACPLHAHWLEGEPISELEAMGGVLDRYRRPLAGGRPQPQWISCARRGGGRGGRGGGGGKPGGWTPGAPPGGTWGRCGGRGRAAPAKKRALTPSRESSERGPASVVARGRFCHMAA